MQLNASRIVSPTLEDAIDRHLLTVAPDTPLEEVIAQMSCARGSGCSLVDIDSPSPFLIQPEPRSSCALVMQGNELAGIFTERDIVRLTAMGADFTSLTIGEVMTHPVKTLTQSTFQDIFAALFLFRRYRVRHLPIVDDQDQLVGIVSPESIRRVLRPANLLKLRRVSDVMTSQVICAPLTASIMSLAQQMAEHWVSCVVIVETDW
ncbi:MAG: CBS domain-containing protein, partial [Pseudanabaenales cyanobacterium]|nr:CBS domain-containing protein [Pseudanabaenales cyanobacterium]